MARNEHPRIVAAVILLLVVLVGVAAACGPSDDEIGSQDDLDSIIGSAGSVRPLDTIDRTTVSLDLGDPTGASGGSGASGSSGNGSGDGETGTTGRSPVAIDTSPRAAPSAFCVTLARVFGRLSFDDYQHSAQVMLDNSVDFDLLKSSAASDARDRVDAFRQAIQYLADGVSPDSPTVQVPLAQFIDWAGRTCDFER